MDYIIVILIFLQTCAFIGLAVFFIINIKLKENKTIVIDKNHVTLQQINDTIEAYWRYRMHKTD